MSVGIRATFGRIAATGWVIGVCMSAAWGVEGLPEPTGEYAVGMVRRTMVDSAREETATEDEGDLRELMLTFWYPAESVEGLEAEPYLPTNEAMAEALFGASSAIPMGIKLEALREAVGKTTTHSYPGAKLSEAEASWPVLIFSHGFGGFREQNRFQAEELASHGYIVVGVDHPYYASAVEFLDGRIVKFGPRENPNVPTLEPAEREAILESIAKIWADDVVAVADELESIDGDATDEQFGGRLDLARMGIFGHSFGGATAAESCRRDARFRCGMNMDGKPYGPVAKEGLRQPFLFLLAEPPKPEPLLLLATGMTKEDFEELIASMAADVRRIAESSEMGYVLTVKGARHLDFSDYRFVADLSAMKGFLLGTLEPVAGARLINDVTLTFFDAHLREAAGAKSVASTAADYEEVEFKAFGGGDAGE